MTTTRQPKYVPAKQALEILSGAGMPISKNRFYASLRSGEIPSIKLGKQFFVRVDIVAVMESAKTQAGNDRQ